MEDDELENFTCVGVVGDPGPFDTLVILDCVTDDGASVHVAADHRMAQAILDALHRGEEPEVAAPNWAIVARAS